MDNIHKRTDQLAAIQPKSAPEGAFPALVLDNEKYWQWFSIPLLLIVAWKLY